ncbi:MAG: glycosyltransferase WbuB [Thalassobius sp.]|nr:glycosyltransferase WbuB [Thalassovita sp.]
MKKICIFTNTFYPEYGAAPNRLLHTALGLKNAGYQVEVITGIPNYPFGKFYNGYKAKFYFSENYQGIKINRFWLFPSHNDSSIHRFLTMFSLAFSVMLALPFFIRKKPDYILLQYPPVALAFPAIIYKKLTKAKFIVNVSDLWPLAIQDMGYTSHNSIFYRLLYKLEKITYNQADLLLAQSNEIKAYLQSSDKKREVLLFRTAVDCAKFKPANNSKKSDKPIQIIYAGVLGLAHGIYDLCKQIDLAHNNVKLSIYGEGFEKKKIASFIKSTPQKNIELNSMIDQQQLIKKMQEADIILIAQKTRIYGTVPSKIYEAMALGKPVLFHGAGEGADIIRQADCGLISHPSDFEQLNKNLNTLLKCNIIVRENMGKRGREAALKYYNRKIQLNNLINTLKSVELGKSNTNPQKFYAKNIL